MSDMSDDSRDVYMSTLATLDNPIRDEYDHDKMENLDKVADEYPDAEIVQDQIIWEHPSFTDISAWETYRPSDENVRVHHPNSPDVQKGTISLNKENVILALQRYSILNRVEYRALQDSSNNSNFVKWNVTPLDDGTMLVNRIFRAFSECIHAFKHCRPILSIDGTHMYGKYNVKLLVAIGHTGILAAMHEPEWRDPKAYHRVCVRHLQSNFMTKVKDEVLKAKLGDVAYAKKELKFKKKFVELLELLHDKPLARKWLVDMDVELWTLAFDHGRFRWGNMTTNASECLNKIPLNGHDLPVSSLVMYTYKQTSAYFVKRSQSPYNNEGELFPPTKNSQKIGKTTG
ncbi:hypothetical protein QQ045_028942 [Rhodiola kirilowii]